jgi:hypothetical protein
VPIAGYGDGRDARIAHLQPPVPEEVAQTAVVSVGVNPVSHVVSSRESEEPTDMGLLPDQFKKNNTQVEERTKD